MARQKREEKNDSVLGNLLGWLLYILVIVGLTYLIITYIGQRTRVSGSSMETTLSDGDNLIVDKLSYRFNDPERYDIIVFPFKYEENTYYIKRIIGLPGETIQVKDGYVYLNGELLESDIYGAEVMYSAGIAEEPIVLGEDEYFVLGDNRNHSSDSRDPSVGVLTREDLIGKAWVRIYPFDQMEVISHE
ncbi:MAG: signal peptidase I [Dorea sp.]